MYRSSDRYGDTGAGARSDQRQASPGKTTLTARIQRKPDRDAPPPAPAPASAGAVDAPPPPAALDQTVAAFERGEAPARAGGGSGVGEAAEAVAHAIASTARAFVDQLRQVVTGGRAVAPATAPATPPAASAGPATAAQPAAGAQPVTAGPAASAQLASPGVPAPGPQPATGAQPASPADADVEPDTLEGRRCFTTMYQSVQARLSPEEQQALQSFQQSWALPERCPFVRNAQLSTSERALLAAAMLVATGTRGANCGDWVMRSYQYAEGDPYLAARAFEREHASGLRFAESRWRSVARRDAGITADQLSLIQPGCWLMYDSGTGGHSILVAQVVSTNAQRGTIRVEAMESGWFSHVNITPRFRTIDLRCAASAPAEGEEAPERATGTIFSIQVPERTEPYVRWLASRPAP